METLNHCPHTTDAELPIQSFGGNNNVYWIVKSGWEMGMLEIIKEDDKLQEYKRACKTKTEWETDLDHEQWPWQSNLVGVETSQAMKQCNQTHRLHTQFFPSPAALIILNLTSLFSIGIYFGLLFACHICMDYLKPIYFTTYPRTVICGSHACLYCIFMLIFFGQKSL